MQFPTFVKLALIAGMALASPAADKPTGVEVAKRATCTVSSVESAASLSACTDVVIEAFTVPSGSVVVIAAADGATVSLAGSVTFANTTATANLFTLDTDNVKFRGNGHSFNGNGQLYWDGLGSNAGVAKPHPFIKLKGYGTFTDFVVKNSPAQAVSIGTTGPTVISHVLIDNLDGDKGALGHNTDGFDLSANDVTLTSSTVYNQDDCLAVNRGTNIVFSNNKCHNGHGVSIGSIATNHSVSDVTISGNTVTNSLYGLRIKVDLIASNATVSGITYRGNTLTGIDEFGVLISQSYPANAGTPGTTSTISDVNFIGTKTTVAVSSSGTNLVVDCGSCSGTWDFSKLFISGGQASVLTLAGAEISPAGTY